MKNLLRLLGIAALVAVIGFSFVACGDGGGGGGGGRPNPNPNPNPGGDSELSGNITITPAEPVTIGDKLTAVYSGDEPVSYQWKRGTTNVGTNSDTHTPSQAGSYTVTVSAPGYTSKTSNAVTVNGNEIPGSTLAEKLAWVSSNAESNSTYNIEVSADEAIGPHTLSYTGKSNIVINLKGTGAARVVSLSSNGALFTVGSGVTLILDNNITLQGKSNNTGSLVDVDYHGALEMKTGAKIYGNENSQSSADGGGVCVSYGGTFTMNGGEISGNIVSGSSIGTSDGGGVYVSGTFTMNGGEISGNEATSDGGGVSSSGTFTMNGGEISGNKASGSVSSGGGVYSFGTFTMSGGKISGNEAIYSGGGVDGSGTFTMSGGEISGNIVSGSSIGTSDGGGVCCGTFTMNGGEISGNKVSGTIGNGGGVYCGTFTMNGGKISGNESNYSGGGVYVSYGGTFTMRGGEIAGNKANGNSGPSGGGGVYVDYLSAMLDGAEYTHKGTFNIVAGTVYGSNETDTSLRNTAGTDRGAALYTNNNYAIAEYGTFTGTTWNKAGDLYTSDDTIKVVNGVLQ
jgi:hypothetical protein